MNNKTKRHLEAVTVCVNYSKYLEVCIPNKHFFDNWIIVTTAEDKATIELCRNHGLNLVLTERLYENGDTFNKGKAINDGLNAVKNKDWIIHIDADTLLPENFRDTLNHLSLDEKFIYTFKYRAHCPDTSSLNALKNDIVNYNYNRVIRALKRRFYRYFGLFPSILDKYPYLNESIVQTEQKKRNEYCKKMSRVDGLYWDSTIDNETANNLKKDFLDKHKNSIIFERNDFKAGFVQMFHSSADKSYSEQFGSASMSDTVFFNEFYEIKNEQKRYKGKLKRFRVKRWAYLAAPPTFKQAVDNHMICYHIGDSYTNWNGKDK